MGPLLGPTVFFKVHLFFYVRAPLLGVIQPLQQASACAHMIVCATTLLPNRSADAFNTDVMFVGKG